MPQLGDRIYQLLRENRMSQRELAAKIGSTEMTVSRYVRNERQPKAEVLARIAHALNTTADELLGQEPLAENEFSHIHRLVARNKKSLSQKERNELMKVLLEED